MEGKCRGLQNIHRRCRCLLVGILCGLCEAARVLPVQVSFVSYLLCAGGLVACLLGLGVADFVCCLLWAGGCVGGRAADATVGPTAVLGVILRKQLCTTTTAHNGNKNKINITSFSRNHISIFLSIYDCSFYPKTKTILKVCHCYLVHSPCSQNFYQLDYITKLV